MSEHDDESVRDAFIHMMFYHEDEIIETYTGTSMPVPQEGQTVTLSDINIDTTSADDSEEDIEQEMERGRDYIVNGISYEYFNINHIGPNGPSSLDTPTVTITVTLYSQ